MEIDIDKTAKTPLPDRASPSETVNEDVPLGWAAQMADLLAAAKNASRFIRLVKDFRTEDGKRPFGTLDYHAMTDVIKELTAAITKAETKESA